MDPPHQAQQLRGRGPLAFDDLPAAAGYISVAGRGRVVDRCHRCLLGLTWSGEAA
jgi:hypothetical protein